MELQGKILANFMDSENPFTWKPHSKLEIIPHDMIGRVKQKMTEKLTEDELEYESAIFPLILCYEYYMKNQPAEALEYLQQAENQLKTFENEQNDDPMWNRVIKALRHLIKSSKTHILFQAKNFDDAFKESCEIEPISKDYVIWGLKASFYSEYGICGTKVALQCANKANEMHPEDSMWWFLIGKFMGRIRRVEKPFDVPSKFELECLEKALFREICAPYTIFAAQVYRETARQVFRRATFNYTLYPKVKLYVDEMNEKSFQLYKKSLELKPKCPHMKFRCAKGFIMLPEPYRDDDLAEKLLTEGLKLAPESPYGHHTMAQFYERRKKNTIKAKHHLKIAVKYKVYGAAIDLLRLELLDSDITKREAVSRLENFLEEYFEPSRRCQSFAQLTSYYIFDRRDIHKAFESFRKLLQIDAKDLNLLDHRSIFLDYHNAFPLQDVVIDEIKLRVENKDCTNEERVTLTDYLDEMRDFGIEIKHKPPIYIVNTIRKEIASRKPNAERRFIRKHYGSNNKYTRTRSARNVSHGLFETESEICRQITRFGEEWKKDVKLNQRYRAPNYDGKDACSWKGSTTSLNSDNSLSEIRIDIYNETKMKLAKNNKGRGSIESKDNLSWRKKNPSNNRNESLLARQNQSSNINQSRKKCNTSNDDGTRTSKVLTKVIDQEDSVPKASSNDDFDKLMANYRKMKISHSRKGNDVDDGNVGTSRKNERINDQKISSQGENFRNRSLKSNYEENEKSTCHDVEAKRREKPKPNTRQDINSSYKNKQNFDRGTEMNSLRDEKLKHDDRRYAYKDNARPRQSTSTPRDVDSSNEKIKKMGRDTENSIRSYKLKHDRKNADKDTAIENANKQLDKKFIPGSIRF